MLALLLFVIVVYWLSIRKDGVKTIKKYNVVIAFLLFLVTGLRHAAIYGDTFGYVQSFIDLEQMTINDIAYEHPKDTFFYIASHYLHPILFHNYTLWLLLIAAVYIYPMYKLVRDFSVNPMWSWICFYFLGLFLFGMAGLRQAVAMGICLNAFLFLIKGDWKKYFALVAIAYFFHGSALVFLLVFPYTRVQLGFNKNTVVLYFVTIVLVVIYSTSILGNITEYLGRSDERYISYGEDMRGATYTYLYQQLLLVIPAMYFLRNRLKEPEIALFAHITVLSLVFISMSPVIAEMFRVSMYFSWANMVLFPLAMKEASKKDNIVPLVFMGIFILYLVFINKFALTDYYFFFQDASSVTKFYN